MHRAVSILVLVVLALASPADAQIEIDGLNHYICHKAKDSKFHPDKFPKEAGRDPASVTAVELRDAYADDFFGGLGQRFDFKKYAGICAPATKEKIVPGGTAGDGNAFPIVDDTLHLVDLQVKSSKKDADGNANPTGTFVKFPKGIQHRVVTQFFDEVVELKGPALALIGADKDDHGVRTKCTADADCASIPGTVCNPDTKTCLPSDPLAGLPGSPRSGPNYLCYKAKQQAKQSPVLVLAQSQFTEGVTDPDEPLLFSVGKMTRLCLPADKAGEHPGAEDGFDHLACYKLKQATKYADSAKTPFSSSVGGFDPGKAPKYKGGTAAVQTFNFGGRVLDLKGAGEFCTPAFRNTVGQSDGIPLCGDGIVYDTPGALFEQCDDGNNDDGDGCSATCAVEGGECGDGVTQSALGEQCDDGNTLDDDGCSSTCQLEFCGDGTTQVGLGEQCDDGNALDEDGCSSACQLEFCGDGTTQAGLGESCDDGNTSSGDGCSSSCVIEFCGDDVAQAGIGEQCDGTDDAACPGECTAGCSCPLPGAFRLDSVAIADPPIFTGTFELTGLVNGLIANSVTMDTDPADGLYDLSLVTLLRPLGGVGTIDLGGADCSFPSPTTCDPQNPLDPLDGFTTAPYASFFSGTCLAHDPAVVGPNNNGTASVPINAPVAGADGCAIIAPTDITLNLLGLELPLLDVEVAAEYSGTPATGLANGLLRGFLDEATANAIILPASLPLVGGQPLSNLLRASELDTGPAGASGWWFHLNFTGESATWTGP